MSGAASEPGLIKSLKNGGCNFLYEPCYSLPLGSLLPCVCSVMLKCVFGT